MSFVQDDHVIGAFTPDRTDYPFGLSVHDGRPRADWQFPDVEVRGRPAEFLAVDPVVVTDEILRGGIAGERLDNLTGGPFGGWMIGNVEVDDFPPLREQKHEAIKDIETDRGDGEEVAGDNILGMIHNERVPRLGRRPPGRTAPVFFDGRLGDMDTEHRQFALDSWRAPQRVGSADVLNDPDNARVDRGPAGFLAALPTPVEPEPLPVPVNDSFRFNDSQRLAPTGPDLGEQGPEGFVEQSESRTGLFPAQGGKLLPECEVFDYEVPAAFQDGKRRRSEPGESVEHGGPFWQLDPLWANGTNSRTPTHQ